MNQKQAHPLASLPMTGTRCHSIAVAVNCGLSGMSMTGGYAGTPVFMPREQITNFKYVKPVSDVWSMGATIYNMLTGSFPYPFTKERDPIDVILNDDIAPIRQRLTTVPSALADALDKALAKKTRDRFQDASEFLRAIKR